MPALNNGNHVVVRDGKFLGIVAELTDGNFVVILPGDSVYDTKEHAISAAINSGVENGPSEEWIHE